MPNVAALSGTMLAHLGAQVLQAAAQAHGLNLTVAFDDSALSLGIPLSDGQKVNVEKLTIGDQGLAGRLFIEGLDAHPLSTTLFDGFDVALTDFDITLANGGLAASHIGGRLTIPFFTDENGAPQSVAIELGYKSDGSVSISLAAVDDGNPTTPDGLVRLHYEIGAVVAIDLDLASLEIDRAPDNTWRIVLSGNLGISAEGMAWPTFELRGLGIDSKGHVTVDGGWINLPHQMALDFHGFHVALEKIGFGQDRSGRWIGFSGDIYLVEGMKLGGSVRGLRINLDTGALSFDGIGIAFEIPDVLSFEGEIDHIHVNATKRADLESAGLLPSIFDKLEPDSDGITRIDVFAGQVKLNIVSIKLEVDANFIVGHFDGESVFFLDIEADLPVGIPIFTDVSLYGLRGLVATGLQPDPAADGKTWWEWYKLSPGYQLPAEYSASDFNKWLTPHPGAFAIGAGATIGTSADDGFTVSAAITLVVMLPGPVISLIGKANILSKRIGSATQEANFEAMATFDGNADTFDLTIEAQYQIPVVLDIEGTAELFVDAPNNDWFFALGKPPHDKRIKARIFDLFESDAYFVVSEHGLITGTWTGYSGHWSFGPLSASLEAYLATLAAIQWSPLQIAGGIELHGDIHLSAFGIGVGLTADALLEGCAPNPFWVHGEISVELDLPWPLPDVGGTISLTWGGDDGSIPPAPLALSHVDVTLSDHVDAADKASSDRYVLLAHRPKGPWPDTAVQYDDPNRPGILVNHAAPANDPPNNLAALSMAPLVPQDAHFTLSFAHPTVDLAGFRAAKAAGTLPPDYVTVDLPQPLKITDDMSHLNPTPPAPQWAYRHTLKEVVLYKRDAAAWTKVCSYPPPSNDSSPIGVTQLDGVWLEQAKADQIQTQLKVFTWRLLPGQQWSALWDTSSTPKNRAGDFDDQGLHFQIGKHSAQIAAPPAFGSPLPVGLQFETQTSAKPFTVVIRFPFMVQIASIQSADRVVDKEFVNVYAPGWRGDGKSLTPASATQSANGVWTQYFANNSPLVSELEVTASGTLLLYAINYNSPNIPMAILPEPHTLYALKTVTKIEAGRANGATPAYQIVPGGDQIVEFAYFQTGAGPGTSVIDLPVPSPPKPVKTAPHPTLAANLDALQQPSAAFPLGGGLEDLHTYTEWSWPQDGAGAAYYDYDVNVEFEETYVNALYTAFSSGSVADSLHFRCVDRNQNHTLLAPVAIHVPSVPMESALVAGEIVAPLPAPIAEKPKTPVQVVDFPVTVNTVMTLLSNSSKEGPAAVSKVQGAASPSPRNRVVELLQKRASAAGNIDVTPSVDLTVAPPVARESKFQLQDLYGKNAELLIPRIDPVLAGWWLHLLKEEQDAAAARALWFKPLLPLTRYTLDVVAGPFNRSSGHWKPAEGEAGGTLAAIYMATDATGVLAALKDYLAYEDALTNLQRMQFTTSRYATFSAQMANVAKQIGGAPGATPIRHYVAATDPTAWIAANDAGRLNAEGKYNQARQALADVVKNFDPLADDREPKGIPTPASNAALVDKRATTLQAWQAYYDATVNSFDGLISALGRPDLVSKAKAPPVPDTELTLFTTANGTFVRALLVESPEPLPWRRIRNSITLTPNGSGGGLQSIVVLWNGDGTRGLIVLRGAAHGSYALSIVFQGNIGAEAPCITQNSKAVVEPITLGNLSLGVSRKIAPLPIEVTLTEAVTTR